MINFFRHFRMQILNLDLPKEGLEELVVFAIQNRQSLIDKKWEVEWYRTMTGIIKTTIIK